MRWFWFSNISIETKSWVSTTKIGHFDNLTHLDAFDKKIVLRKCKLILEVVLIFKKKDWAKILGIYDQNWAFWQLDASWRIWQANSAPKNFIHYSRWFWFSKRRIEPKFWVSTTKIGHFDKLTHLDVFDRQIVLQKILFITWGGFDFRK